MLLRIIAYKYPLKGFELLGRDVVFKLLKQTKRCELDDVLFLGGVNAVEVEAADSRPVGSVEEKLFGHAFRCFKVLIILGGVEGTVEVSLHSEVERGMRFELIPEVWKTSILPLN